MTAERVRAGRAPIKAKSGVLSRFEPRRAVIPASWLVLAVFAYYLPYMVTGAQLTMLQQAIYTAVGVMSLNLLIGMSGQISIGQSAYVGIAAYATAILVQNKGWSYWEALPVAIALAFVLGVLTGLPALRITGLRLALATLSIAIVFPTIPVKFTAETGGTPGMNVKPLAPPASFGITVVAFNYWVLLTGLVIVWILMRNLQRSRIGRSLIAMRDHQIAAYTVGINVAVAKVLVFGASAAMCGLVGWMFVITNQFVSPADFTTLLAIYFLVGMAIGGPTTLIGPIFAGLFIIYAPGKISNIGASPLLTPLIYGLILILLLFFLPGGFGGVLGRLGRIIVGPPRASRPALPLAEPPPEVLAPTEHAPPNADAAHLAPDRPDRVVTGSGAVPQATSID